MIGFFKKVWNCFAESITSIWESIKGFWIALSFCEKLFWFGVVPLVLAIFYKFYYVPKWEAKMPEWTCALWNFMTTNPLLVIAIIALAFTWIQVRLSRIANRDNRFAKAAEMLGNNESLASQGGGLYMLLDLIREKPKKEYIRCAEVICCWIREEQDKSSLIALASEIFTGEAIKNLSNKTRRSLIAKYKNEHNRSLWPNLANANLSNLLFSVVIDMESALLPKVDFSYSNLKGANLQNAIIAFVNMANTEVEGADFSGALIVGAKMERARGLTKEQILSATWKIVGEYGEPPELPDYLLEDSDVQEWLENPPFRYEYP